MTHEVFTIVAPIRDRAASTHLKQILAEINANPSGNARLPFVRLPMVHFASFVVFSDPVQDAAAPRLLDHLVFESCIDGPFDEYIKALLHLGLKTLHELFSCCRGYDATVPSCDCVRDVHRCQAAEAASASHRQSWTHESITSRPATAFAASSIGSSMTSSSGDGRPIARSI